MKSLKYILSVAVLLTAGIFSFSFKKADEPTLKKVEFQSHTNDDDKDHDTGIYITVKTADGETTLGSIENKDNSGDDGTQYKDGSDHAFLLNVGDAAGLAKSACRDFKVHIWQHTHGHDTWKFNGKVILYFTDGTQLSKEKGGIALSNDGAGTDF